jgi:UDP-glucose 4-epimerase
VSEDRKTVLITGVAGFIGRYVARYFAAQGWDVVGIDGSAPENAPLSSLTAYHSLRMPSTELGGIIASCAPTICIHCAGRAAVGLSMTEPATDFYGNTVMTFELLDALRLNAPNCRFIFLSSAAVYGNPHSLPIDENHPTVPLSPYGFHKLQSEQLCQEFSKIYGLPTASMRIFSAYGPGLRRQVLWDICQKAVLGKPVKLQGTGAESRDFVHALDIANALMVVGTSAPMGGEVYNLATGMEVKIVDLASLVLDAVDYQGSLDFDGVVPTGTPLNWRADISKLVTLGFTPSIELEPGVKSFANWCKAELLGI